MDEGRQILDKLRGDGHRITKARSAIVDILLHIKKPLTARAIFTLLNSRGLTSNRATVYRELGFLLANDIVCQVRFAGKAIHYEINSGHHHHLVCLKCDTVKDVVLGKHLEHQERQIYEKEKFKVVSHSLEFYGLCNNCRENRHYE
ncbi:MAG TPA: transcriptional repressor [Thermodesulfovibrionales bacterium]|nr:transcriptional repressor [Thermodesulfovibrionales bacterium]